MTKPKDLNDNTKKKQNNINLKKKTPEPLIKKKHDRIYLKYVGKFNFSISPNEQCKKKKKKQI
jgi:hypothetical protein